MAVIFTVEDGTGLEDANSYVDVIDADDYFEIHYSASTWQGLDDATKEILLMRATKALDHRTEWRGSKTVNASGLRWPRRGVYDKDKILLSSVLVPQLVKDATCEVALFLLNYNHAEGQGGDNIRRVMVDVVEVEYQEDTSQNDWPTLINSIIMPLGTFRTGGPGFGKILKV